MLRFTCVTLAAVAIALALGSGVGKAQGDARWIIEPGPEAADAQKQGAADVARAQKLAKDKHFDEAQAVLENVARTWPASVHDCNLALAYLRNKQLTRAKLVWDLGEARNGVRPKWCTGEVSTQISDALRKASYVPTTVEVTPNDAVVEVSGIAMRNMRTVWLAPGVATFNASAQGYLPAAAQTTIAAPTGRVTITLEQPRPETPDAGVPMVTPPPVTPDAAVAVQTPVQSTPDAGVESSLVSINGSPIGRRTITLVTTLTLGVAAGVCGYLTYDAKTAANEHYKSDPAFNDANDRYKNFGLATSILSGATAVSAAFYIYFLTSDDKPVPSRLHVRGGPGDIGISFSGTFGGAK